MHMDHGQIQAIHEALNQELVLGREDLKDKFECMTKRQVGPGQLGRPRVEANSGDRRDIPILHALFELRLFAGFTPEWVIVY